MRCSTRLAIALIAWAVGSLSILMSSVSVSAATYYVSPTGSDAHEGHGPGAAWRTVAKVNAATFAPGDQILFARGGQWRESLRASSSGASEKPIVYAAYGAGAKPKFWGSDALANADFQPAGRNIWRIASSSRVGAVLADRQFLATGQDRAALDAKPDYWFWDEAAKALFVSTSGGDPRTDKRAYSACRRIDPIHSQGKNHLVFRDLVSDESADARDGYGFRVQGSQDVRLENCEAYRAGRHHFGCIDSTEFVGQGLHCAYAMPNIPGGATFYVSFSDPSHSGQTHRWIDCTADHLENPGNRNYQIFFNHGEGLGALLIKNMQSHGGKLSLSTSAKAPATVEGGLIEDASLEIFGDHVHVDGLRLQGDAAIDQFGSDGLLENVVLGGIRPVTGGPTGYSSAIVFRDGAKRNTIRFSTVVFDPASDGGSTCLAFVGKDSATRCYGNVLLSKKAVVKSWAGKPGVADLVESDFNFLPTDAAFVDRDNRAVDLAAWRTVPLDHHSLQGEPRFVDSANGDYTPKPDSPLLKAATISNQKGPPLDRSGRPRNADAKTIGAYEGGPIGTSKDGSRDP